MKEVAIVRVDLAKERIPAAGSAAGGAVVIRRKLSRPQFQRFISEHPRCVVAMQTAAARITETRATMVHERERAQ